MKKILFYLAVIFSTAAYQGAYALNVTLNGTAENQCNFTETTDFDGEGAMTKGGLTFDGTTQDEVVTDFRIYCNEEDGYHVIASSQNRSVATILGVPIQPNYGVLVHPNIVNLEGTHIHTDAPRHRVFYTLKINDASVSYLSSEGAAHSKSTYSAPSGEPISVSISIADHSESSLIEGAYSDVVSLVLGSGQHGQGGGG